MGRLAINGNFGDAIIVDMDAGVKEWKLTNLFRLGGKLDVRIETIDLFGESLNIILVAKPHRWWAWCSRHHMLLKLLHVEIRDNRGYR